MQTLQKRYYIGDSSQFPEIQNGNILYAVESGSLYIDINNERKCIIPRMGDIVKYDIAKELGNTKDIPMTYQVYNMAKDMQTQISRLNDIDNKLFVKTFNVDNGACDIWLEDVNDIDVISFILGISPDSYVRIINFTQYLSPDLETYIKLDQFYNKLNQLHGLDKDGNHTQQSQIYGEIQIDICSKSRIDKYNRQYPNIKFSAINIYDYELIVKKSPQDSIDQNGDIYGISFIPSGDVPSSLISDIPKTERDNSDMFEYDGVTPEFDCIYGDTVYTIIFKDDRPTTLKYLYGELTDYVSNANNIIAQWAFYNNRNSIETVTTSASQIGSHAFDNCYKLNKVDLTNTSDQISLEDKAFYYCPNLKDLIIRSNYKIVCSGTVNSMFNNSLISKQLGVVYVQPDLVDVYKADNDFWGNCIIKTINDYPFDPIGNQWEEVINNTTTYATDYQIGKTLPIVFNNTIYDMELIAFDTDDKADGSGKARMTWICKNVIISYQINSDLSNDVNWLNCDLRKYLRTDIWNSLPDILKNNIVEVNKTYYDSKSDSTKISVDTIWIPSVREIFGADKEGFYKEDSGADYSMVFKDQDRSNKGTYWLRTAVKNQNYVFYFANNTFIYTGQITYYMGIIPCFCI